MNRCLSLRFGWGIAILFESNVVPAAAKYIWQKT